MSTKANLAIGAALNFSSVPDDLDTSDVESMPLFAYLRGRAVGLDPDAMAGSCFRLGRVMVCWAVESREAGGAQAVGVSRLNLARRFREAGRKWRERAEEVV
jgi:hypothetical protein